MTNYWYRYGTEQWENGKVLTWCPDSEEDDGQWLLVARKVGGERGQPPVAASPSAQRDFEEEVMFLPLLSHRKPQVVRGAALELKRSPALVIGGPGIVRPHEPDRPPVRRRLGAPAAEQADDASSWLRPLRWRIGDT
jgi:hypothetical protein